METEMTAQTWLRPLAAAAMLTFATVAAAQQSISSTDIQRLQDQVYQAGGDVSRLRSSDASLATRLETELDDLRDEVIYLKVKIRKEGNVNRTEYAEVRDRLQDLRTRARTDRADSNYSLGGQGSTNQYPRPEDRDRDRAGVTGGV